MQISVSPEINELIDAAASLSVRKGQYYVGVEHLFAALVDKSILLPKPIMDQYGSTLLTVARELERDSWKGRMPTVAYEVFYTPRCAGVAGDASKFAQRMGSAQASAGHLLLAILADAYAAPSRVMDRLSLGRGDVIEALRKSVPSHGASGARVPAEARAGEARAVAGQTAKSAPEDAPAQAFSLADVTRDLTNAARHGEIDKAIGREKEIFQILQVLARQNKNNVILVGEAGVGKTKVVEGLAVMSVHGGPGAVLAQDRILELNIAALMTGTQYRGAFEEKIIGLLDEIKREKNIILFIDEVHLIMGAGATEGSGIDFANLLKPSLARGEIRCIGATTLQEYRKFIEKDPAIERRFQMVRIEALSEVATWEVLNHIRPVLERHHKIRVSRRAMRAAITLTQRYMPNRQLPDKAIDVLDQACARYRLKAIAQKSDPKMFDSDASRLIEDKVTPHDIRKIISQVTSIPVEEITSEERQRLDNLERKLNKKIIGQDEAVAKVVAAVKKSRAGLADPNRPDAVMLFLGPTGVGKTQLAKELADQVFGSAEHLITFDMSEYVEEHSVARLLGAPPGYVGSEEEGRLTGAVRYTPFSILLFDEVEKAHPRVFDILLPVLEEGRLKDSHGRDVSFKNCVIIFTSNIGAHTLRRSEGEEGLSRLMQELRQHFRPEFINRIDEIVPFYPLLFEDIRIILRLTIAQLGSRLKEKGIGIRMYQGAYEHLAEAGYNQEFGARELRRAVERLVINPISDKVLSEEFTSGDTIEVLMEDGRLAFRKAGAGVPATEEA
ncbi:MAG: ATP-dependent Clp protease ATP-binding subunit [Candidatus Hydrogenedentes bacterium]|nr:ATP-dependent Clp protease ATP-binding subunit [Candidatus Hydrogenedentota bacterium]